MRKGYIYTPSVSRYMTNAFNGINMRPGAAENEWADICNMVLDNGCLRTRPPRGLVCVNYTDQNEKKETLEYVAISDYVEDICALHDGYAFITQAGELIVNGIQIRGGSPKVQEGMKRYLVPFGRSFMVLPDGVLVSPNADGGWEQKLVKNTFMSSSAEVTMCKADGTTIDAVKSAAEPSNAENGAAWIDTSGDAPVLCYRSAAQQSWVQASSLYMKIKSTGISKGFSVGDVVTISDMQNDDINGSFEIIALTEDSIVVVCVTPFVQFEQKGTFTIERDLPVLDFCIQHNNRLWGCRKGYNHKGEQVNEIYASKLGDPLNWFCYQGISTDSYAASISSPGAFTGVGTTADSVVFFKSDSITAVYGSQPSDFNVQTFSCEGVQPGSGKSVVTINGMIYYKSSSGVYVYSGYQPYCCSEQLAGKYTDAYAAAAGDRYYIRMKDENGEFRLFVFDTIKRTWVRENCGSDLMMLTVNNVLYFARQKQVQLPMGISFVLMYLEVFDATTPERIALSLYAGMLGNIIDIENCTIEDAEIKENTDYSFCVETTDIGLHLPDHKRVQMLQARVRMDKGSILTVYAQYDAGPWIQVHETIAGKVIDSLCIPIASRRCDRMRLKLEGRGNVTVYSLTRSIESASEVSVRKW